MTPTKQDLQNWFDEYNTLVFYDKLPRVPFALTNNRRQLGQFWWKNYGREKGIKISLFWDRDEKGYRNTLLHEMCHLYCYHMGWKTENHGERWQDIARYAGRITGMDITRCTDAEGWVPAKGNEAKFAKVVEKINAPAIIVDFDCGDHHFIVKTTKKVVWDNTDKLGNNVKTWFAKSSKVYISNADLFKRFRTARTIDRGHMYKPNEYEKVITPILKQSYEVESLRDLYWGNYDCLLK